MVDEYIHSITFQSQHTVKEEVIQINVNGEMKWTHAIKKEIVQLILQAIVTKRRSLMEKNGPELLHFQLFPLFIVSA